MADGSGGGHTSRVRTSVDIPCKLLDRAARLARRLGIPRSQLYREAVAEYVARHDPEEVTRAMNRVVLRLGLRGDGFVRAAARRSLDAGN
jgi:predicted DNA-binding protein